MNLFNEKKIITSSNYQEFTEGLPFVVAAVVAILAVPGDTDKKRINEIQIPALFQFRKKPKLV